MFEFQRSGHSPPGLGMHEVETIASCEDVDVSVESVCSLATQPATNDDTSATDNPRRFIHGSFCGGFSFKHDDVSYPIGVSIHEPLFAKVANDLRARHTRRSSRSKMVEERSGFSVWNRSR